MVFHAIWNFGAQILNSVLSWAVIWNDLSIDMCRTQKEVFNPPVFECRNWCSGKPAWKSKPPVEHPLTFCGWLSSITLNWLSIIASPPLAWTRRIQSYLSGRSINWWLAHCDFCNYRCLFQRINVNSNMLLMNKYCFIWKRCSGECFYCLWGICMRVYMWTELHKW